MESKLEVVFREFRKEDMDALYFLHQRCHALAAQMSYAALLDTLLDTDSAALVAEARDDSASKVVGGMILKGEPWERRLAVMALMVEPPFRRQGIGNRLLRWAQRLAGGYNMRELVVLLEEGHPEGEAFLAANDFAKIEKTGKTKKTGKKGAAPSLPGRQEHHGTLWKKEVVHEPPP